MGKKHKHPEHENLERWLVSYADFITLLFATFVVLYALGQADLKKLKLASASIREAFNPGSNIMKGSGGVMNGQGEPKVLDSSGNSILKQVVPKYQPNAQKEGVKEPSAAQVVQQINREIEAMNKARKRGKGEGAGGKTPGKGQAKGQSGGEEDIGLTTMKVQERGVVISFASSLFFEPGTAGLKPEAYPILDKVAPLLSKTGTVVHIEGHTDNQPIASAIFPSNWELSCARASSVLRYFITRNQMSPYQFAAVGYGDTRPIAENSSVEGRQKNRRVDIVILKADALSDADAGAAQETEKVVVDGESEGVGTTPEAPAHGAVFEEESH